MNHQRLKMSVELYPSRLPLLDFNALQVRAQVMASYSMQKVLRRSDLSSVELSSRLLDSVTRRRFV